MGELKNNLLLRGLFLVAPTLGATLIFAVTRSVILTAFAMVGGYLTSWLLVRFVFIDRQHARYLAAATICAAGFACATVVALSQTATLWQLGIYVLQIVAPDFRPPSVPTNDATTIALVGIILAATVAAVSILLRSDNYQGGDVRKSTDLSERQLSSIARTLKDHLDALDHELRFFDFRAAAIDPKLEELNSTSRYVNIRSASQIVSSANAGQFIVVKGEPGSGKSVMLRNLTRLLLGKVLEQGKIPILLNLREWTAPTDQTTVGILASLDHWIKSEYRARTGPRQESVADEEFSQLYAEGSFVFLFDSFDENPTVSKSSHNSARIRRISQGLAEYVRASGGCVGLVFSREYKAPSAGWIDHKVYAVRPFADKDIKKYISENCAAPDALASAVFGLRPDLYAMAKSPLLLGLLTAYVNRSDGALPDSEFDIFDSFVDGKIDSAIQQAGDDVDSEVVYATARRLARGRLPFAPSTPRSNRAAEVSRSKAVSILRDAKILRGDPTALNFSHKRFQEYFRVLGMLQGEETPPSLAPGHIDNNRDVLNLYAQICPTEAADDLAAQAFANLMTADARSRDQRGAKHYEAVILSLRFLNSAFRNRPDAIDDYRAPIREIVVGLWNTFDILKQKHAVEHIGLLPPLTASNLVRRSLEQRTGWLRRVALWQARYLSALQPWLGRCVAAFLSRQNDFICLFDRTRSNTGAAMANAEEIDRWSVAADICLRCSLVVLVILVLFTSIDVPLLSVGTAATTLILYGLIYLAIADYEPDSVIQILVRSGFNGGLSGFIAFSTLFNAFWNILGAVLNNQRTFFWAREGILSLSIVLVAATLAMLANNHLVRRRDNLDELGVVNPLSKDVLSLERPRSDEVIAFVRRNGFFFVVLALFVAVNTTGIVPWALTLVVAGSLAIVAILAAWEWLKEMRSNYLTRRDNPKVIRFARHFTGQRAEIAAALANVSTDAARVKILNAADAKSGDFIGVLRDETNVWPGDGSRPRYSGGVDSYLAVLDERWLGLA